MQNLSTVFGKQIHFTVTQTAYRFWHLHKMRICHAHAVDVRPVFVQRAVQCHGANASRNVPSASGKDLPAPFASAVETTHNRHRHTAETVLQIAKSTFDIKAVFSEHNALFRLDVGYFEKTCHQFCRKFLPQRKAVVGTVAKTAFFGVEKQLFHILVYSVYKCETLVLAFHRLPRLFVATVIGFEQVGNLYVVGTFLSDCAYHHATVFLSDNFFQTV